MLDNDRFGYNPDRIESFIVQARHYYNMMLVAYAACKERVRYVNYETFARDKMLTVSRLASWAELGISGELKKVELQHQYGPMGHKREPTVIQGVGRWVRDLSESDATRIMDGIGRAYSEVRGLETAYPYEVNACCADLHNYVPEPLVEEIINPARAHTRLD
jgi:hypothetical protein